MKIVILDAYTANPGDLSWDPLKKFGELVVYERTAPEETLARIQDADIVLTNKVVISAEHMAQSPHLKFISVLATGYNIVDLAAAKKRNIPISNVPAYSTPSVAQMTFAMLLEICNQVGLHHEAVNSGEWATSVDFCFSKTPLIELMGKTMGLFGFGSIGKAVTEIARAFGLNVLATTSGAKKYEEVEGVRFVDKDTLFAESDIISMHCPLTPATNEIINAENIAKMKHGVIILNTARGGVVNENDVRAALKSGQIAWYSADVVSKEPIDPANPLLSAPNCILTPHIAWASHESRERLLNITFENVAAFAAGAPINVVN